MSECSKEFERTYNNKRLEDQFSDRTRVVRRNLLLLISMVLFLSFPDIKFGNFLWLNLSKPEYVDIARGTVTIAMALELIVFISYGITDFLNWNTKKYIEVYKYYTQHTKQLFDYERLADKHLSDVTDTSISLTPDDIQKQEKTSNDFRETISKVLKHDTEARYILGKKLTMFNGVLWVRIFIIDWLIPLSGAFMGLKLNYESMIDRLNIFIKLFTG